MHKALLWEPHTNGSVRCTLCNHYCTIAPGRQGLCGVRKNLDGVLYTLTYPRLAAMGLDPVEKKPLYHFYPGTSTFSIATMGCNMRCQFCQNASLSQPPRQGSGVQGQHHTPKELVAHAHHHGADSISYTYSEPTVFFELMKETAEQASGHGLKNILVSNGFMSAECLNALGPTIQAANIDLKAFTDQFYKKYCGARLKPVLENLVHCMELGWWLEVTTLIIPGLNDSPEELRSIAQFIANDLGPHVPWHLSRFHPQYQMHDRSQTAEKSLVQARTIGLDAGLHYVYVGNVPGNEYAKTLCPQCKAVIADRFGFTYKPLAIKDSCCIYCNKKINGVGLS